jgi:enoyl reductase
VPRSSRSPSPRPYPKSFLGGGFYPLKATITWKIQWTGTGGAGGDLPDGNFGATQDVVVQEIQAVNR